MKIIPKPDAVNYIVNGIQEAMGEYLADELERWEAYLISHGASKKAAEAIMSEVRLLIQR